MIYPTLIAIVGKQKSGKTLVANKARKRGFHVVELDGRIPEFQEIDSLRTDHNLLLVTQTTTKADAEVPRGSAVFSLMAEEVWVTKLYRRSDEEGGPIVRLKCLKSRRCNSQQEDILI